VEEACAHTVSGGPWRLQPTPTDQVVLFGPIFCYDPVQAANLIPLPRPRGSSILLSGLGLPFFFGPSVVCSGRAVFVGLFWPWCGNHGLHGPGCLRGSLPGPFGDFFVVTLSTRASYLSDASGAAHHRLFSLIRQAASLPKFTPPVSNPPCMLWPFFRST